MADIAINFAGRIHGFNMTSKPNFPLEANYWVEWDFVGWIVPQILLAMSLGANCLRLIGDVAMVQNGLITQATYNARTQQLIGFCVANGLAVYLTGCATYGTDGTDNGTTAMTDAQIAAIIISNVAAVTSGNTDYRKWIPGLDVVQEANANLSASRVNNIYSLVKPSVPSPIGCTFSTTDTYPNTTWLNSIIGSCDYLDPHIYPQSYGIGNQPSTANITSWMANWPTKDFFFGEGGADFSAYTSGQVTAWIAGLAALGNMPASHGWLQWAVYDQQSTTQLYGAFDASGNPRSNMVLPFIKGLSASATLLAPSRLRVVNNKLIWDPTGCTNAWASTKLYRDGVQIANPIYCYYDDSANWRGTAHTYTVTALDGSGESAPSNGFVYPLGQVAQRSVRAALGR